MKIFKVVLEIQEMVFKIPGQVEGDQPVYLIDAMNRRISFDLNFITSAEVSST